MSREPTDLQMAGLVIKAALVLPAGFVLLMAIGTFAAIIGPWLMLGLVLYALVAGLLDPVLTTKEQREERRRRIREHDRKAAEKILRGPVPGWAQLAAQEEFDGWWSGRPHDLR